MYSGFDAVDQISESSDLERADLERSVANSMADVNEDSFGPQLSQMGGDVAHDSDVRERCPSGDRSTTISGGGILEPTSLESTETGFTR